MESSGCINNSFKDHRGYYWTSWKRSSINRINFKHDKFSLSKKNVLRGLHGDDKTWKLVESGSFQAGALSESVWERANKEGSVDTEKIRKLLTTPSYFNYHWVLRAGVDSEFGSGFTEELTQALLGISKENDQDLLDLFQADSFIATSNSNYDPIETVARELNLVE